MSRFKRKAAAPVVDLYSSDGSDTVHFAPPKRQKIQKDETIDWTSDVENDHATTWPRTTRSQREPFRQLNSPEWTRKSTGPIAFVNGIQWKTSQQPRKRAPASRAGAGVKAPVRAKSGASGTIKTYFRKPVVNVHPQAASPQNLHTTTALNNEVETSATSKDEEIVMEAGRPLRQAARKSLDAFKMMMRGNLDDSEQSEDELISSRATKKPESRGKPRHYESDFEDESESAVDDSIASEVSSASEAATSQDTEDDIPVVKKRSVKGATLPKSSENGIAKPKAKEKSLAKNMENLRGQGTSLEPNLPPMSDTREIFQDITDKALHKGLQQALDSLPGPLKVATMCSGTESPLLALEIFKECLGASTLKIEHLFSAEIVAFKQAYIERNFRPPIIFRDICELTSVVDDDEPMATTAYGGKVPVPRVVDLLIAGTSCVDYSMLNRLKKTIDDGGESGDTYAAVLAYCKAFRPSIVILENVLGAPWDRMLSDYEEIGYVSSGAFLDSKRFYDPQTRQRGYMVCFDQRATDVDLTGAGKVWTDLMAYFKRPASSPASAFLLPSDQMKVRPQLKDDGPIRDVDWTKCELRHTRMRYDSRLGNERPVTHWSESGSLLVPEGGDPAWYARMPERVWDLLDMSVLRKALPENGFYDARYKTRIWDVSQNVDFQRDTTAFGIIGCITPTMMPFLSDAGRVLMPEELLKLQGLPSDKVSFTTETPSQIQDLAGNAMSTTVIGPAILSALIAGHHAITRPEDHDSLKLTPTKLDLGFVAAHTESIAARSEQSTDSTALAQLLQRANQAGRRCVCESSRKMTTKGIQKCTCCGHTACVACAGNPVHVYKHDLLLSQGRLAPNDFEDFLRKVLPLNLSFRSQTGWQTLPVDGEYKDTIKAIGQQFSLQSVRRTYCWTITYTGTGARLELSLAANQADWRLFADIPKHLPCNSHLRAQLEQPVVVGTAKDSFFADQWQARVPKTTQVPIEIRASAERVASWWARNGMPDFVSHTVPAYLDIEVRAPLSMAILSGRYQYLPHCGKACDSLFKRMDDTKLSIYLFLDPTGTGEPDEDRFVFSTNIERLEYDEVRTVFAAIAAPWRPWNCPGQQPTKPLLTVSDSWHDHACHLASSEPPIKITRLKAVETVVSSAACTQTVQLLSAFLHGKQYNSSPNVPVVAKSGDGHFLADHKWVLEAMGRSLPDDAWRSLTITTSHRCGRCAPSRPALRWALQDTNEVKAYEHVPSAAAYEQAIKSRPQAIVLAATQMPNGLRVDLGINMATLAHRAKAKLPKEITAVEYSWRLLSRIDRTPYVFKKFRLSSNEDTELHHADTGISVALFPQQKQSLAWMIRQEKGIDFTLEESEEEVVAASGWMAEVRARGTITVRGGICADHPGFGKTITSLALIGNEFKSTSPNHLLKELQVRQPAGLQATAATLIMCPHSLVQQWIDEIKDKLGLQQGVHSITTPKQLSAYTVADFTNAKIIVVNRTVLASVEYTDRLASFAAAPGPAATRGRAFMQWRDHAVRQIPEHLAILKGGKASLVQHIKDKYDSNMSNEEFRASVPSRRHRGQNYVANKTKKLTPAQQALQAAPAVVDTTTVGQPLFEMFYFNRLIVDEFHDYEATDSAATTALKADKRWGLSGTPAIEDFFQVAQMSKLLGIDLPIGSMDAAVMKSSSRKVLSKDMSTFEQFDTMWRQLPSQQRYTSIHALHQRFLCAFARQNLGDFSEMKYQDHLVPVHLEVEHRLLYTELSQHLNTLQMRIKHTGKSRATDRNRRLNDAVSTSSTAEEALSKAAAFMDQTSWPKNGVLLDDLIESCNVNIQALRISLSNVAFQAMAKEKAQFNEWKSYMLDESGLPDHDTIQEVSLIFASASKGKAKKDKSEDNEEGKEAATHKLTRLCTRLLMERRSLRYLATAKQLQNDAQQGNKVNRCTNSECAGRKPGNYALSAVCGHLICEMCYEHNKKAATTRCTADGCSSAVQQHHLLWSGKMGDLQRTKPSPYGAKLEKAMQLLQTIQRHGEQAIIFVQFEQQVKQVALALEHHQISNIVVESAAHAGGQLKAFRESADSPSQHTVIVLNAADETAAGSNLQNANHVIFLSPLLQSTQYKYDSTMAQALGRVRRFGQNRSIHVYRIVALDTIDVDVLEHRERRSDALTEQHGPSINAPAITKALDLHLKATPERVQLVREDGHFSLRPQSWLVKCGSNLDAQELEKVRGKSRIMGWEDFSSLIKFSTKYTEDDE